MRRGLGFIVAAGLLAGCGGGASKAAAPPDYTAAARELIAGGQESGDPARVAAEIQSDCEFLATLSPADRKVFMAGMLRAVGLSFATRHYRAACPESIPEWDQVAVTVGAEP